MAMPQYRVTMFFLRRPYMKYPKPMQPNSSASQMSAVSMQ